MDDRLVSLLGSSKRSRSAPVDPDRAAYVLDALAVGVAPELIALKLAVPLRPRERLALRVLGLSDAPSRYRVAKLWGMPQSALTRARQSAFRKMVRPVCK